MAMSVYEIITDRIIESLKLGVVPWRKTWTTDAPKNLVSGREYRGVNVLLLQASSYACPYWLTYNQARAKGGQVRKGEKGCPVVFWKVYDKRDPDARPGEVSSRDKRAFVLRYFTAFNAEQCDGIQVPAKAERPPFDPIAECEAIVARYPAPPSIAHGGGIASYSPPRDAVQMPLRESFDSPAEYYSTLFHELAHSTGHASRLDRRGITDPIAFGSHKYAKEELVAECGAAFLCARAGIERATIENSAAYLQSWIRTLRSEPRWIVDAAAAATKAADLIAGKVQADEQDGEAVAA